MIDITLDNYSGAAVHVSADHETGLVRLTLDIEDQRELHDYWQRPTETIHGILDASRQVLERGDAVTVRIERQQLAELVGEIDRLRQILESGVADHSLDLDPDEARAAAAMLRHYAKDVERR